MITINRVIDVDGIPIHVRVTVESGRVEIVWDRRIPPSIAKKLLLIVIMPIADVLLRGDNYVKRRHSLVKILKMEYPEESYILNNEPVKRLKARA